MLAATATAFAGCNKNNKDNKENKENETHQISDQELMEAIAGSNPTVDVEVGEYEHLEGMEVKDVDALTGKKGSSSWLDAPKDIAVNILFNHDDRSGIQYSVSLMKNLVNANKELHTISIVDRGGSRLESTSNSELLTKDGEKITVSKPGGFDYGEVYQIELNDASFLYFENKDISIRTLTIEIEDDPNEEATYNEKTKKTNITNVNLNKVINKKVNKEEETCSFEYVGTFPNLSKDNVFYATGTTENDKLDFYGLFQ